MTPRIFNDTGAFDDVMIQERKAALDRVHLFHTVAEQIEDVIGQNRFCPDDKGIASFQNGGYVQAFQKQAGAVASRKPSFKVGVEEGLRRLWPIMRCDRRSGYG